MKRPRLKLHKQSRRTLIPSSLRSDRTHPCDRPLRLRFETLEIRNLHDPPPVSHAPVPGVR